MSEPTPREWHFYLNDMVDFANKVLSYTDGLTQREFIADGLTYDATLRNLELIGEAATRIPDKVRSANPQVPWRLIIATRNRLIHGYLGIDDDRVEHYLLRHPGFARQVEPAQKAHGEILNRWGCESFGPGSTVCDRLKSTSSLHQRLLAAAFPFIEKSNAIQTLEMVVGSDQLCLVPACRGINNRIDKRQAVLKSGIRCQQDNIAIQRNHLGLLRPGHSLQCHSLPALALYPLVKLELNRSGY